MAAQTSATDLVSLPVVAEAAGVSERTLRRWISDEALPLYTQGNRARRFLKRADAERLVSPRVVERRRHDAEPVRA